MHIKTISYNPKAGAFEARVDIERDGRVFRYPCQVPGPVTLDLATVRQSLTHQARRMSDSGTRLYSHH